MTPDFAKICKDIIDGVNEAVEDGVSHIGERAKELCPVETGETRDSIEIDPKEGTVSTDCYKALWLEYGTENMPPHAFMRPAFDHGVRPMIRNAKNAINEAIGD